MTTPTKAKAVRCKHCNYVLKVIPFMGGTRYAHKKRAHWLDKPHKAVPASGT